MKKISLYNNLLLKYLLIEHIYELYNTIQKNAIGCKEKIKIIANTKLVRVCFFHFTASQYRGLPFKFSLM